jgi:phosphatidylserine/phosphatidylglycerophosphate/cardiolipin synthase-like enzyme
MIASAKKTILLSEFYASDVGSEREQVIQKKSTTALGPVLAALDQASDRGVKIRFLLDESFLAKYPATVERLRQMKEVTVRAIDASKRYGGIQHSKYIVVDGEESFVGSQNFDWRSLTHIQEIGLHIKSSAVAGGLSDIFDTDWALAEEGAADDKRSHAHASTVPETRARSGEALGLFADPKGWLPDETRWDLKRLVSLIDGAKKSVSVQVLTYSTQNRDKSEFKDLDDALRRAAGRGVTVHLLVSHWGANSGSAARKSVESLAAVDNVEVKVLTIPPWSGGEIPFARVAHAKYMVVDGRSAWVGTSNWEGDYFLKSRNVAVVANDGDLAPRLGRIFEDGWGSNYAKTLRGVAPSKDTAAKSLSP